MLELFKVIDNRQLSSLGQFECREDVEEFVGQDLIEELSPDATYMVTHEWGFVGCFTIR